MITRSLIALLFAVGMLFGGSLAAEQPAQPDAPAPTQPAEPMDPVEPADPVDPVEPIDPVEPEPVEPAPIEPVEPVDPVEPEEPVDPIDPVAPEEPQPLEPLDPLEPEEPLDPADPEDEVVFEDDFFTRLTENPELTAFAQAFEALGLQDQLDPMAEYTVFAPADTVVFDPTALETQEALATYIVEGAYTYADLRQLAEDGDGIATLTTMDGQTITVELIGDTLLVAGVAQITEQDIEAAGGYIHVIDAVIQPTPAPIGG